LQQGLAVILGYVGVKMIASHWYHVPTPVSLAVIALVLLVSIVASTKHSRGEDEIEVHTAEPLPPYQER
jgi:tellurite resistance protein TerC